ncbi:hypothetical protein [Guptibacillus hwajinpoensis]|nr:hypothetical protein [Alkalihalobacillus macyae]
MNLLTLLSLVKTGRYKIFSEMDDYQLKLVKVEGDFVGELTADYDL